LRRELWINKDLVRTLSFLLMLRPTGGRKVHEEFNAVMNGKAEYRKHIWSCL
jgi:CRISPR-associated protein Cas1